MPTPPPPSRWKIPDGVDMLERKPHGVFMSPLLCVGDEIGEETADGFPHCGHPFTDGIDRCCDCGLPADPLLQKMLLATTRSRET